MLYVDLKYISTIGTHLRNFKKKKENLYNCSCPICGDSEKKKTKARGYFYQKNNSMFYRCHNCGSGLGLSNFLKQHFPSHHDQYVLEKYKSGVDNKTARKIVEITPKIVLNSFVSEKATKLSDLSDEHYAKQYVLARKIPKTFFTKIYFTPDFADLVEDVFPGKYSNLSKNDSRLIIPFFNSDNKLIGLQGRSFSPERSLRYITIRAESTTNLIYGLDQFDGRKTGYVVEGPIDSMFLPNCLAAANSDLESVCKKVTADNLVLIYDNEPRNKEIVRLLEQSINSGKKVCIWPSSIVEKDINDMILSGVSSEDILSVIKNRTFCGLEAHLEFCRWKKI